MASPSPSAGPAAAPPAAPGAAGGSAGGGNGEMASATHFRYSPAVRGPNGSGNSASSSPNAGVAPSLPSAAAFGGGIGSGAVSSSPGGGISSVSGSEPHSLPVISGHLPWGTAVTAQGKRVPAPVMVPGASAHRLAGSASSGAVGSIPSAFGNAQAPARVGTGSPNSANSLTSPPTTATRPHRTHSNASPNAAVASASPPQLRPRPAANVGRASPQPQREHSISAAGGHQGNGASHGTDAPAGGSQSFHHGSAMHNGHDMDAMEEEEEAAGPIGLMNPDMHHGPRNQAALTGGSTATNVLSGNNSGNIVVLPASSVMSRGQTNLNHTPSLPHLSTSGLVIGMGASDVGRGSSAAGGAAGTTTGGPLSATAATSGDTTDVADEVDQDGIASPDFYNSAEGVDELTRAGKAVPHRKGAKGVQGVPGAIKQNCCEKYACPASCGGYNFVKVFVIMSAVIVVVTSFLVFGVGYLGLVAITNTLSNQVRTAVMQGVLTDVNNVIAGPLRVARAVHVMTRYRHPDIDTLERVTDRDGWLADLAFLGTNNPGVARVGFLTVNNVAVWIARDKDAMRMTTNENMQVAVAEGGASALGTYNLTTYVPEPTGRYSLPDAPPLLMQPEVRGGDPPDRIKSFLGDPVNVDQAFDISQLRFWPAIAASVVNNTIGHDRYGQQQFLATGWSPPFTARDRSRNDATQDSLSIVAYTPAVDANNPSRLTMASFAMIKLLDLSASLARLPFGKHGMVHLVRAGGDILASSDATITQWIEQFQTGYHMGSAPSDLIRKVGMYLRRWGLAFYNESSDVGVVEVPYTNENFSATFRAEGHGWKIEARMLDRDINALPWTLVLLTRDDDFDGGVQETIRNSAVAAAVICVLAMVISFLVTRCISKPLLSVVDFMGKAVKVIRMERGQSQRLALQDLCESWSASSGMILPPLANTTVAQQHAGAVAAATVRDLPHVEAPLYKSFCWLCTKEGDTCCCYRVGRSLREVQLMHAAFSSMLYTLASYDELDAINQAKRQFIRYIFHEVRVPFNAIVMGIEQMQMDLAPHYAILPNTLDTLDILSEQSAVVSRILNDVLSMQKIEDGALALEYDQFSLEKMIRGALYAFRTPCLEKRLKVRVNLQSLDQLVNQTLPGLRLGKVTIVNPSQSRGGGGGHGNGGNMFGGGGFGIGGVSTGGGGVALMPGQTGGLAAGRQSHMQSHTLGSDTSAAYNQTATYVHHANVRGDPYRLRQVLANFISNAVKFTPTGGLLRVSLDVSRFEANPLAVVASDHLMAAMNGRAPGEQKPSRSTHASWLQAPTAEIGAGPAASNTAGATGIDTTTGVVGAVTSASSTSADSDPPLSKSRPAAPILPELLGTVMVRVAVKDSGNGIPLDHQQHIFEAYMQVQAGKIQKGNGTGLGLNISKSIVELHGGQIGYTSVAGEGCEFFFSLPLDVMLVKSGSRGDSSSYGHSSTGARSRLSNNHPSERKLETITGSPDLPQRDLRNSAHAVREISSNSGGSGGGSSASSAPVRQAAPGASPATTMGTPATATGDPAAEPLLARMHSSGSSHLATTSSAAASQLQTPPHLLTSPSINEEVSPPGGTVAPAGVGDAATVATSGNNGSVRHPSGDSHSSEWRVNFHEDEQDAPGPSSLAAAVGSVLTAASGGAGGGSSSKQPVSTDGIELMPTSSASPPASAATRLLETSASAGDVAASSTGAAPALSSSSSSAAASAPTQAPSQPVTPPVHHGAPSATSDRHHGLYGSSSSSSSVNSSSRSRSSGAGGGRPHKSRGAHLGVTIPSANSSSSHSSAQNLTASVKPGLNAYGTSATSAGGSGSAGGAGGSGGGAGASSAVGAGTGSATSASPLLAGAGSVSSDGQTPGVGVARQPPKSGAESAALLAGSRVLVVEDSQPNRKLLMSLLTHMGCKSFGVENGQECVDLFKEVMTSSPSSKTHHLMHFAPLAAATGAAQSAVGAAGVSTRGPTLSELAVAQMGMGTRAYSTAKYPFDCILMDGSMPVMNGVEATQILRQHGVLLPIIAVTGNALAEDVNAFIAAGASHVLTKPINRKKLHDVLATYLPQA